MIDDYEVKPCPFCGGQARASIDLLHYDCQCAACGATVYSNSRQGAIKKWNTRENNEDMT